MRWLLAILLLATGCDVKVVATPLGRITVPNEYGVYPEGALEVAQNVCMRDPGVLSSMPGLQTLRTNAMPSGDTARAIWSGDAYQLVMSQQGSTYSLRWVDGSGATAITSPSAFAHSFGTGIAPVARQRARTIVGTSNGLIVVDGETDSTARTPGFNKPLAVWDGTTTTGSIANGDAVSYRALFRRTYSDGYEVVGPLSEAMLFTNTTGSATGIRLLITVATNSGVIAGDTVEVYRTRAVTSPADPGDVHYLVGAQTITASDITATRVLFSDRVPQANLGAEAYGNPGQSDLPGGGGPLRYKRRPPMARDMVLHGDHLLYLGTTTPASIRAYVPHTWGALTTTLDRQYGIGTRTFTADRTDGSPILTNISAADIVGLAVGQRVVHATALGGFSVMARIITVGATSVTLDRNLTGTSLADPGFTSHDMISIAGELSLASNYSAFAFYAGYPAAPGVPSIGKTQPFEISSSNTRVSTVTAAATGVDFFISRHHAYEGSFTLQASNGANYQPPIADFSAAAQTVATDQKLNRAHWAELAQPEAAPADNTFLIGNGEIYRAVSVGGSVLVFASDGLWIVAGDGINGWAKGFCKDPELILAGRLAVDVMGGLAWAQTSRGLVSITPEGDVAEVSGPVIGGGAQYADTWDTRVACDRQHREVLLTTDGGINWDVYNTRTRAFVSLVPTTQANAAAFSKSLASLVFATATAGGPSVEYFRADTSTTRLANASVRFQPIVGDEPTATKEWGTVEYVFDGLTAGATLVPSFSGTNYNARTLLAKAYEQRVVVAVPKAAPSYGEMIRPGFTFSAGGTTQLWTLRTMTVYGRQVSEHGVTR